MLITIGMRDLARDSSILSQHDLIDIEDKRTHKYKGVFVSAAYAPKVKDFVKRDIEATKQKKLDAIMSIAGSLTIDPKYDNLTGREMRMKIAQEKYGKSE